MADVVKRAGRIVYVEPNNINGLHPNNSIPYNYEDYCISINLRVFRGDRFSCGMPDDNHKGELSFSSNMGNITFIGGTNGYLSTNFTDISMNNPETNTNECLGIESINIDYNSWYYPQVKIKFVDVRGASLMLPAEYEMYNSPDSAYKESVGSSAFFSSLFTYPYPLFKLSVKGFYGKEVTYDLSVSNVKINFNSQTGNFEANVEFIGYMYGVYSEIPMSLMGVFPYMNYGSAGKVYWENKKNAGEFVFREGNNIDSYMVTYPEFAMRVSNVSERARQIAKDSVEGRRLKIVTALLKRIKTVTNAYYDFKNSWVTYEGPNKELLLYMPFYSSSKTGNRIPDTNGTEIDVIRKINKLSKAIETYNKLATEKGDLTIQLLSKENTIHDIAKAYIEEFEKGGDEEHIDFKSISKNYLSFVTFTVVEDPKKIGEKLIETINKDEDQRICNSIGLSYMDFVDVIKNGGKRNERGDIIDETGIRDKLLKEEGSKYARVYLLRIYEKNPLQEANNIIERLEKEREKLLNEIKKIKKQTMREGLGFNPSIRNIFNMSFAHMNTFVETFYECLKIIKGQIENNNGRLLKDFIGGDKNVLCDLNDSYIQNGENNSLPPFTCFYQEKILSDSENGKNKTYEVIWPGNLPNGNTLEEVKFVKAIAAATVMYHGSFPVNFTKDTGKTDTNRTLSSISFYPLTLYDFVYPYNNPYTQLVNRDFNKENILDRLLFVFCLRCYYFFLMNGNNDTDDNFKLFGVAEAQNLFKAMEHSHVACSTSLNNELLKTGNSVNEFVDEFLKNKIFNAGLNILPSMNRIPIFENRQSYDSPLYYKWIGTAQQGYYLPVSNFNINEICNDIDIKNYKNKKEYIYVTDFQLNKNSCNIISDSRTFEQLENLVYCENKSGQSFRPLFSNFTENMSNILYDVKNDYYDNFICANFTTVKNTVIDFSTMKDRYNADGLSSNYSISYPSIVRKSLNEKENNFDIIFGHPIYYNQVGILNDSIYTSETAKYARAYLFVCGIPIVSEHFIAPNAVSGTLPKVYLLREGAIYWRRKFMEENGKDPINVREYDGVGNAFGNQIFKEATKDETYNIKFSDNVINLSPIYLNDKVNTYYKFDEPNGITQSRIERLIEYFKQFANSSQFGIIDENYSLKIENKDDKTLKKVTMKQLLESNPDELNDNGIYSNLGDGNFTQTTRKGLKPKSYVYTYEEGSIELNIYNSTQDAVKSVFGDFDTIIDTAVPYESSPIVRYGGLRGSVISFINELKDNFKPTEQNQPEQVLTKEEKDVYGSEDFLKSIYEMLRNLYNKWFCSNRKETWDFNAMASKEEMSESDFSKFKYMDNYYHDISDKLMVNAQAVCELLKQYTPLGDNGVSVERTNKGFSFYKYLADICQKNGMTLLALPSMYGMTFEENGKAIEEMFKPIPFNESKRMNSHSSTYVALYTYKLSEFLNVENDSGSYGYKNDGCDIADSRGNIISPIPATFADGDETSMLVPAFGVTFAKQNQSYFKNIKLDMNDHQQTEFSLRTMFNIAEQGSQSPRSTIVFGQDLYRVYSSYAYTCSVDMMGDAQIMPLMYFQLNNIPLWKGLYMIIKVSHAITSNGEMTTSFSGVRINKYAVPYVDSELIYIDSDYPDTNEFDEEYETEYSEFNKSQGSTSDKYDIKEVARDYAKLYSSFVNAGNNAWKGKIAGGGNIYTLHEDFENATLRDFERYLNGKGWREKPISESLEKFGGNGLTDGMEHILKYLIVHITDSTHEELINRGGWRPAYNVYIDENGDIKYLWYIPKENQENYMMSDKHATYGSKNYNFSSINMAFYGKFNSSNGEISISDATKKTLQAYIVTFAQYHVGKTNGNEFKGSRIIGHNQIGYGPDNSKPYSPGFHMPTMLNKLAASINDKDIKQKLKDAVIHTDNEHVMQNENNAKTYIDGSQYFYTYSIKKEQWIKEKKQYSGKGDLSGSQSGIR